MSPSNQYQRRRTRRSHSPLVSSEAIAIARDALAELGHGEVGEHVGVSALSSNVATHRFGAQVPGYPGWEWNAVVACADGSDVVTVNEVALVPAPSGQALQAPDWVPYSERVRPGDLGPGDIMPPAADDERLETTDDGHHYLSDSGRRHAIERWRTGDYGPNSEMAAQSQLQCKTCAFFLVAGGQIGSNFGVCANEYAADGRLVHATYGCGAHSEVATGLQEHEQTAAVFDDEKPIF